MSPPATEIVQDHNAGNQCRCQDGHAHIRDEESFDSPGGQFPARLPTEELAPLAEKLFEVPMEQIRTALDLELTEGSVIADSVGETPCVFLAGLHRAERAIADGLYHIRAPQVSLRCLLPKAISYCLAIGEAIIYLT
jgi:hypothetical protein